ncbi:hypothetical protein ABK040_015231 [Willaertia magna]
MGIAFCCSSSSGKISDNVMKRNACNEANANTNNAINNWENDSNEGGCVGKKRNSLWGGLSSPSITSALSIEIETPENQVITISYLDEVLNRPVLKRKMQTSSSFKTSISIESFHERSKSNASATPSISIEEYIPDVVD